MLEKANTAMEGLHSGGVSAAGDAATAALADRTRKARTGSGMLWNCCSPRSSYAQTSLPLT